MPDYIWEKVDKILDLIILLVPIIIVLVILLFIGIIVSMIRFRKKHNAKLRQMEERSRRNREFIEKQRKKHFPDK